MRHQFALLFLQFLQIWTAGNCDDGHEISRLDTIEALQIKLKESELQKQQLEKVHEKTIIKLAISQVQNGDVDSASDEFQALKNRDALVEDLIQLAYDNTKVQLPHLTSFVCKINGFTTGYTAMNVLYQLMVKNNQTEQKEIIPIYYKTLSLADCKYFKAQPSELQNNILDLKTQIEFKIMTPLVEEIKNRNFSRTITVVNNTKELLNGDEIFLVQLTKFYIANNAMKSERPQLLNFVRRLPYLKSMCHAYNAIWRELGARGAGETMEALAVWSHASEIVTMAENMSDSRCVDIAQSKTPAYTKTLDSNYNYYIKYGHTDKIKDLHVKYYMRSLFADYLSSLNLSELQNGNFNKVVDAIYDLPYISDVCYAVAAVSAKFKSEGMFDTFEHFQILQIIKKMRIQINYAKIDQISKDKCEEVEANIPPMFHKLLYKDTTNCMLLNRYYLDEPMFCTNSNRTEFSYRQIFTRTNRTIAKDQYWNVSVADNAHGVVLRNRNQSTIALRFVRDNVRGSDQPLDLSLDYFRIHTKDTNFFLLEPMFHKAYVAACIKKYDSKDKTSNFRWIGMIQDPLDKRAHWKLVCTATKK